ncbi:MAG: cytochrome c-type biogenesis protein CcmH [Chromatiaceae bacterium]|nr:MAG: cytochrome c-type biogenesis protein CcmH [Chromatiaceae bacterium]
MRHLSTLLTAAILAATLSVAGPAAAFTLEEFEFDSPQQQAAFRDLIGKLRCLVCQNESLAGSRAELAQDLRNEVYKMLRAGTSEEAILDFLVARYGDFVLYEPPLKPSTYLLWYGPFALLGLGALVLGGVIWHRRSRPEQPISAAERQRLQDLLAADGGPQDPA